MKQTATAYTTMHKLTKKKKKNQKWKKSLKQVRSTYARACRSAGQA